MSLSVHAVATLAVCLGLVTCAMREPAALSKPRSASATDVTVLSEADRLWVVEMVCSGQYLAQAARLAEQRSQNPQLKAYAMLLAQQHEAANEELALLVRGHGMPLLDGIAAPRRATLDALAVLPVDLFDRRFVEQVGETDLTADTLVFEAASRSLSDAALRSWAGRMLPMLRQQQALARDLPVRAQARQQVLRNLV